MIQISYSHGMKDFLYFKNNFKLKVKNWTYVYMQQYPT